MLLLLGQVTIINRKEDHRPQGGGLKLANDFAVGAPKDDATLAIIQRGIAQLAGQGVAVLMISSEMPEVLGMSDRVMVMHEGRLTGIVDRKDADQVRIMELASQ